MSFPGSSPRWREVEARLRAPSVRPTFQVIHRQSGGLVGGLVERKSLAKQELCERFCAKQDVFREIRWLRAEKNFKRARLPSLDAETPRLTAREIIRTVAAKYELGADDIISASRCRVLMPARFEACYEIARQLPSHTLPMIAMAMGGRDHTSILAAIRRHMEMTGAPSIRGLRPKRHTWTDERIAEAEALLETGLTHKQAAEHFGVSRGTFSARLSRARIASKSTPTD